MRKIFAQGFWGKMTTMDTQTVARKTIDYALRGKPLYIPGFLNCVLQWLGSLIPPGIVAKFVAKRWRAAQDELVSIAAKRKNLETT